MSSLIPHIPDPLFFLGILFLGFCVYRFVLDDDMKANFRILLSRYWFWILLIVVGIYGWRRWGIVADHPNIAEMNFTLFLVFFFALLYFGGKNFLYEQRYNTNYFIADGIYGSCALRYDVGKYTVFYLGTSGKSDYKSFALPWGIAQRIAIVPKISLHHIGNCVISTAQVFKYDLAQIDQQARRLIEADGRTWLARDEIYYGEFSEKLRTEDPSVSEIESRITDVNYLNTMQKKIIEDKEITLKKSVTNMAAIQKKLKGDSARPPPPAAPMEE